MLLAQSNLLYGSERSLLTFLEHIPEHERGNYLCVVPNEQGALESTLSRLGYAVCQRGLHSSIRVGRRRFLSTVLSLRQLTLAHGVEVAYANNASLSLLLAALKISRWFRIRTVVHSRDILYESAYRHFTLHALWLHDRLIFNSYYLARANCPRPFRALLRPRIQVLHNVVDVAAGQKAATKDTVACGAPTDARPMVGMFGRYRSDKRFLFVLQVLSARPELATRLRGLILVGKDQLEDPEYWIALRDTVRESAVLSQIVRFVPFQENVWPHLMACDIVLIPSTMESFGRVAIEAGALGKCVLAARWGGSAEVIQEGETGLLWSPDDAEDFAVKLERVAVDDALRRSLGDELEQEVRRNFGVGGYCTRLRRSIMGKKEPTL